MHARGWVRANAGRVVGRVRSPSGSPGLDGLDDPVVHRLFDAAYYRAQLRRPVQDALAHHVEHGWRRGLDPHPLISTQHYLDRNPDVAAADVCPLVHFARFGGHEGRDPHPLFDLRTYAARAGAFGPGVNPLVDYLDHPGRPSPNAWFDADAYLAAAPDVAAAGTDPMVHYLTFGWREGRRPHPDFDPAYYLAANADVAEQGIEPLTHFVARGRTEGRLPRPGYDIRALVATVPHVGLSPPARAVRRRRTTSLGAGARRHGTRPVRPVIERAWRTRQHDGHRRRVLAVGVVLADHPNTAPDTSRRLAEARRYDVDQRWVVVSGRRRLPRSIAGLPIVDRRDELVPKYQLLDEVLGRVDLDVYDYVLLVDDDVVVPRRFLDVFLDAQRALRLGLAQPARTTWSSEYPIVAQHRGLLGRETLFVEQGPVLSIHRSVLADIVPFDLRSPMGWGYENIWSARLAGRAAQGIIDATPVDHTVRPTGGLYAKDLADRQRVALLAAVPHVSTEACMRVVSAFAAWPGADA